ncbi:MAG: DeoR/GlpR family DNA-binding transcription regulator [Sphaerochaetaceae bacterium]
MNISERKAFILQKINLEGSISIKKLATELQVSEMTIRRDLDSLELTNLIKRKYGKAFSIRGTSYEPSYQERALQNHEKKVLLGRLGASLVKDGDSVAFDTGTTVYKVAQSVATQARNLTVITHSLNVVDLFKSSTAIEEIIVLGGVLRKEENSMVGDLAVSGLQNFYTDKLFLGVGGINDNLDLTEFNYDDAIIKRQFLSHAQQIILLADSSKFTKTAFVKFGNMKDVDVLITDKIPPQPYLTLLRGLNVKILIP